MMRTRNTEGAIMLRRARAMVARVSRGMSEADLDDLASDLVVEVLVGHHGEGLPSARWLRWRALNVVQRRYQDEGVPWAPERIDQC